MLLNKLFRGNTYTSSPKRSRIPFIMMVMFLYSCTTPDSNEQAKVVLDNWCECMQKHRSLPSEAHRICTEKYREDLTQIMLLRSEEVMNDSSFVVTQHAPNDSSNIKQRKRQKFEQMGKILQEMSKKCLDGL